MVVQCRACLNTKDTEFIRMDSDTSEGVDIFECFCLCTQLNAERSDGLPEVLCSTCSQDLQVAFNFVQNARQADKILRENLSLKDISVGVVETLDDAMVEETINVEVNCPEDCLVEEFIEDEQQIDVIMNEVETNKSIEEKMEVKKKDEESNQDPLNELDYIGEKPDSVLDSEATDELDEKRKPSANLGDYYTEDECDNEYLREFQGDEIEDNNLNAVSKGSKWKCIECKRVLCGDVSYEGHMNMHRSLRPYKCNLCLCAFRCKKMLEGHSQLRHQNQTDIVKVKQTGKCYKCSKEFVKPEELHEHYELVHSNGTTVQCRHCPAIAPLTRPKFVEHFRNEHPEDFYKHFPFEPTVKITPWQCNVCGRFLRSVGALEDHQHTHRNERPHECQFCKKRFFTSHNLRQHMRNVHMEEYEKFIRAVGDAIVQCEICKKEVMQRNFDKHMTTHKKKEGENVKKFLCAYCSRECKNQKSLNQHEKMHQGESPDIIYICSDCERSFGTQHLLEQHRKKAHKERDHICPICGNAFKLKNQLANHMKLHLEKNIKCPHCEKCYARKFDLDVHLRSHTGELPFACHLCERRFAIKVRLTYHLQKHYGIKHRCKECGAEFNSKQKLKAHSYKHTGMPYRCEKCDGHGFANRDVFKRHLQRVHSSSMTDEELVVMFQQNTGKTTRICRVDLYEEHSEGNTIRLVEESEEVSLIASDDIALETEHVNVRIQEPSGCTNVTYT